MAPTIDPLAVQGRLLLTYREASVLLAISERMLWELARRREIPVVRLGRSCRIALSDVEALIARRRESATSAVAK